MLQTKQVRNKRVTTRLIQNALTSINQDHRQITEVEAPVAMLRVYCSYLRGISNNEFTFCVEVAVSNIDGDALLTLSLQAINKQC